MVELEFKTEDERLYQLGLSYWKTNDDSWAYKTTDLERQFGAPRNGIARLLKDVCVATLPSIRCTRCGRPQVVESRARADALLRSSAWTFQERRLCTACSLDLKAMERQAELAIEAERQLAIARWVNDQCSRIPPRSYADLSVRHAFLLLGLLRYGATDWRSGMLEAWDQVKPKLWSTPEQIAPIYLELFGAGWIRPDPETPKRAFDWSGATITAVRPLQLSWILANDSDGLPVDCLEGAALSVLDEASPLALVDLWEWVCLNEVRDTYHYYASRFSFHGPGWTDTMESNVRRLLQTCTVSQVRSVMKHELTKLAADLQGKVRHRAHTYNMLPGGLLRFVESLRGNDREIFKAYRLSPDLESLYTGLLFDAVMQGGSDLYHHATGNGLRNLGESSSPG